MSCQAHGGRHWAVWLAVPILDPGESTGHRYMTHQWAGYSPWTETSPDPVSGREAQKCLGSSFYTRRRPSICETAKNVRWASVASQNEHLIAKLALALAVDVQLPLQVFDHPLFCNKLLHLLEPGCQRQIIGVQRGLPHVEM